MLKTRVIASNIKSLTDARYFAAQGVDYILYNLSILSVGEIRTIQNWLEGIPSLIQFPPILDGKTEELLKELNQSWFDGTVGQWDEINSQIEFVTKRKFLISDQNNVSNILQYRIDDSIILRENTPWDLLNQSDKSAILNNAQKEDIYLDLLISKDDLRELILMASPFGLVLKGGHEEKTGMKSFGDLDEVFEFLEG